MITEWINTVLYICFPFVSSNCIVLILPSGIFKWSRCFLLNTFLEMRVTLRQVLIALILHHNSSSMFCGLAHTNTTIWAPHPNLKNYSFLYDFETQHFLLVNTIIRNSRDQNICLVPSPKYSIDKTRPSSPSPATIATLVSSHTMSQLHQSSTTLTCSVCDRVKRI